MAQREKVNEDEKSKAYQVILVLRPDHMQASRISTIIDADDEKYLRWVIERNLKTLGIAFKIEDIKEICTHCRGSGFVQPTTEGEDDHETR